jgi:hypothetical protein
MTPALRNSLPELKLILKKRESFCVISAGLTARAMISSQPSFSHAFSARYEKINEQKPAPPETGF